MEMTVIYDQTGHIFYCAGGNIVEPIGLPFVKVIIPDGKILKSINPETKEPIFEDEPKTKYEQELDDIKASIEYLALISDIEILI